MSGAKLQTRYSGSRNHWLGLELNSVLPLRSLCLCGARLLIMLTQRDTEHSEVTERTKITTYQFAEPIVIDSDLML
jgi:hypothetical protein